MKVLMHICCGPCSASPIKELRNENIDVTGYWFNPNIHPYQEYDMRKKALESYSKLINLEVIYEENYGLREFSKNVIDKLDNRCEYCYRSRLEKVAVFAKENGYDAFTTTLLVSPYQKHNLIKKVCEELSKKYEIDFLYRDFRPYFKEGQSMFRETGLYMQKYCGCIFSEEERYYLHLNEKLDLPENFEFVPETRNIVIKKVKENKEQYMYLLLEADPEENVVKEYLSDGELFILTYNDEVACAAVITKIDDNVCELKNIATLEKYRGQGIGKKMIKYLFDNYKQKYSKMIVGTTENNIPFYVKQGFDRYYKTIKNFFVDNYEEEIWDGDLHCFDIYYYSKDLTKLLKDKEV